MHFIPSNNTKHGNSAISKILKRKKNIKDIFIVATNKRVVLFLYRTLPLTPYFNILSLYAGMR